jgi:hypothetical protein
MGLPEISKMQNAGLLLVIAMKMKMNRMSPTITTTKAMDNDGTLDKESTSYNDIFDAFRLALKFYHFEDSSSSRYN